MSTPPPTDLETAILAAREMTSLPTDEARAQLTYDPIIGEQALVTVKPSLLAMAATQVLLPNFDAYCTALVARNLAEQAESDRFKAAFDRLSPESMGEARAPYLKDLAQALFFLESRARSSVITRKEVRIDPQVISEGIVLRNRMLRVLDYHFEDSAPMQADLTSIRANTGHMDLASDLVRLATHYSAHREALAADTIRYDAAHEHRARGVANEIAAAQRPVPDSGVTDLRNRCWTKTLRVYGKLRIGAELVFFEHPVDFEAFPPLRQAVLAITRRKVAQSANGAGTATATARKDSSPGGDQLPDLEPK